MFKRLFLAAVLGTILGIPLLLGGTAQAATAYTSFTMQPQAVQVGEPVVLTDTTVNRTGLPFEHDWIIYGPNGFYLHFTAGGSLCLDPDCSKVQLVPMSAGRYNISESAHNSATDEIGETEHLLAVSDADHPLPFQLVTPTTVELPSVIEVLTPSSNIMVTRCEAPALLGTHWAPCDPYQISQSARNSDGLYRFRYRLPMAPTGPIEITFSANSRSELPQGGASDQEFTFDVLKSNKQFTAVESCYKGGGNYSVTYFADFTSKVTAKLQVRRSKSWVTRKRAQAVFTPDAEPTEGDFFEESSPERSPWFHRYLYFHFGPVSTLGPKTRIIYEIKRGSRLLKKGHVSKKPCNGRRQF